MFSRQKSLGKKVVFYVQPCYINDKVAEMCHVREEDLAECILIYHLNRELDLIRDASR